MRQSFCIISIFWFTISCVKPPDYPIIPEIEFVGFSKNQMIQDQFNTDSVLVLLTFTDGDGDLGDEEDLNIFVTDKRDDFLAARYRIPFIPVAGANNGLSGEITLTLFTTCCTFPNGQAPCTTSEEYPTDQVVYEIYLVDRAGNKSNVVETSPITLLCN